MSPSNINSFVGDLVQMAQAMEQLPKIEAELSQTREQLDRTQQDVQDRELAIVNYKREIEELHAKVRSLEVERDDASFRVLEAEDQTLAALGLVKSARISMESVISILDPPKPEPVKEQEADPTLEASANSTEDVAGSAPVDQQSAVSGQSLPETVHSISEVSPGQSESSPTTTIDAPVGSILETASHTDQAASTTVEPTHGPYFGKRYVDVDGYVSYHDWLDGGGTHDNYYGGRGI